MRTSPLFFHGSALVVFVVSWSVRSWLLSFPPNACRGERCGVWRSIAPSDWYWLFLLERFLFVFRERFFSPRAICYPQRIHKARRPHHDLFGSVEERAPSIYRSSSLVALSGDVQVRRSKEFSYVGERVFSSRKSSSFDERFSVEPVLLTPAPVLGPALARWRFARGRRPVTRQATMAFLRAAAQALRSASSAPQRRSPR